MLPDELRGIIHISVRGSFFGRRSPRYGVKIARLFTAIRAAADVEDQLLDLSEFDVVVVAAIAYHQPIARDELKGIFGKEISRDLIGTGPRSPRRGAAYTFVTTEQFLVAFGLESLLELPDREQLTNAGLIGEAPQVDFG